MHRRHLIGLGLGAMVAACVPLASEADTITKLGADESVGLTVMHGGGSVACGPHIGRGTTYAIQRGWYLPPDPTIDYGLHIDADGTPCYQAAVLMLTPTGRARGEEVVRQWEADEAHPFHKSALRERAERTNPQRQIGSPMGANRMGML